MNPVNYNTHQSPMAVLASLMMRHQQSADSYQEFAKVAADDPTAADFFSDLATYRRAMYREIEEILNDSPSGAQTPSKQSQNYLDSNQGMVNDAISSSNVAQLRSLVYENENDLLHYLGNIELNEETPETHRKIIEDQAERIREVVVKTDRYKTVG